MTDLSSENLSEVLFKPTRKSLETSFISNSVAELPKSGIKTSFDTSCWFRQLSETYWGWLGCDMIKIKSAIARIAASKGQRTREGILDTVYEYGPGNWIYEFSMLGRDSNLEAQKVEEAGDKEEAYRLYRLAYLYYDIASYPHLRGDELGSQATLQHYINYRKAAQLAEGDFVEIKFPVAGERQQASAFIHTPDKTKLCPCVIVCSNLQNLATEYLRIYRECFYPHGIALVACDLPGMGLNSNISLTPETGIIHSALIDYIKSSVPFIDQSRIGVMAQRFGGNVAVHLLTQKEPDIKCCCIIGPLINEYFTNKEFMVKTPSMQRANIANKMNFDAAQWDNVIPQLQAYSVKKQGVLNGLHLDLPIYIVGFEGDYLCPKADLQLLKYACKNAELEILSLESDEHAFNVFAKTLKKVTDWLVSQLKSAE